MPWGRFVSLSVAFAIEGALRSWWVLSGWYVQDAEALGGAVRRAAERVAAAT